MGMFDMSLTKTPEAQLHAALNNLSMYQEYLGLCDDPRDKYGNKLPDYLLDFIKRQINDALKYLAETTTSK